MNPILTKSSASNHRDGGRYYNFSKLFGKKRPNIEKIQFVGLAGTPARPIFTVARPTDIESVLALSLMNVTVSGAPILWLGSIKCYKMGTGLKYYVPKHLVPLLGDEEIDSAVLFTAESQVGTGIPIMILNTKGKVPSYG